MSGSDVSPFSVLGARCLHFQTVGTLSSEICGSSRDILLTVTCTDHASVLLTFPLNTVVGLISVRT